MVLTPTAIALPLTVSPAAFTFTPTTNVNLNSVSASNSVTLSGINTSAYVTYGATSTGTSIQGSVDGGTTWSNIPATGGTSFTINSGQTLTVRLTTGATISTGYTAEITVGDASSGTSATFTATTAAVPDFPNIPPALAAGPSTIPGTASGTWADGTTSLTSTSCIEFKVGAGSFNQGPTTVNNGDVVTVQWLTTAPCGGAASGTVITGTLTNGTNTNSYSLTLDRNPDTFTIAALTGQATSTTATSGSVTLAGTNSATYITYTAGSPDTLTNLQVSVNSGAYVTVPTSGTTVEAPPGATLQFKGDVGALTSTAYTITVNAGTTTAVWSVTTSAVTPTITTPSIISPANGTTNINPATNLPPGISLVSNTYTANNGAGTPQTSSEWEVYKWNGAVTSAITSTSLGSYVTLNPAYATSIGSYSDGNLTYTQTASGNQATFSTVALSGKMYWETTLNGNSNNTPGLDVLSAPGTTTVPGNTTGFGWETSAGAINLAGVRTGGFPTAAPGDVIGWAFDSTTGAIRIFLNGAEVSFSPQTLSTGSTYYAAFGTSVASDCGATYNFGATAFSYTAPAGYVTLGSVELTFTDATNLTNMAVGHTLTQTTTYTPVSDIITNVAAGPILTLSGNTELGNFFVGDTVTEVGGSGDATGVISAINSTTAPYTITLGSSAGTWNVASQVQGPATAGQGTIFAINSGSAPFTITLSNSTGAWGVGKIAIDAKSTPVAPATTPPNSTEYTAFPGSPIIDSVSPFVTVDLLQANLVPSSTYYGRVRYATTNPTATTSSFSAWSSFGTAAAFVPAAGAAIDGGYFGGQINDGGIIYNLIVAPAATGQYNPSGTNPATTNYKTTNSADSVVPYQNEVYGFPANQLDFTSTYPAFQFARSLSIGGFNDWYIPAKKN